MANQNQKPEIRVFYDGSCPLCKTEIEFYQRLKVTNPIEWVNISGEADANLPTGLSQQQAMERFHIVDANGQAHSGARAFLLVWMQMPAFRRLGRICSWTPIERLLEFVYGGFLRIRPYLSRLLKARANT